MTYLLHMICVQHLQHILLKVNEINQSMSQLKVKKLYHFSAFHNFRYEEDGIRVWQVHSNLNMRISTVLTRMRQIFLLIKSLMSKIHQDCLYQLKKKQLCRKVDYFTVLKQSAITAALRLTTWTCMRVLANIVGL